MAKPKPETKPETTLATDLLVGARAIAVEIFGDDSDQSRKKVYYLASLSTRAASGGWPIFRSPGGSTLLARRSELRAMMRANKQQAPA